MTSIELKVEKYRVRGLLTAFVQTIKWSTVPGFILTPSSSKQCFLEFKSLSSPDESVFCSQSLDRSRGRGDSYTDPSAVAQLEQCHFIKANKRMKLQARQIITWLQICLRCVLGVMHWLFTPWLTVWQETEPHNVTIPDLCQAFFSWHRADTAPW